MQRAGQTPHGARPNREGAWLRLGACRLGAPQPPGRSLEPRSNARPRGMTVLPETADRIRLTGPAATILPPQVLRSAQDFGCGLPLRSRPQTASTYRPDCLDCSRVASNVEALIFSDCWSRFPGGRLFPQRPPHAARAGSIAFGDRCCVAKEVTGPRLEKHKKAAVRLG